MTEDDEKILPKDVDTDHSLPGRFEESNSEYFEDNNIEYFETETIQSTPNKTLIFVIAISFVVISSLFFSYYFINQNEIDSKIIQNTFVNSEQDLINQYGVGEYGTDHVHAAIAIFVDDEKINFSLPQFQLSSKYIHFENHNSYLIHKHATGAPLDMLFISFGMKITPDCIMLNNDKSSDIKPGPFCTGGEQSLLFFVNGEQYYPDISQYEIKHNDRILISFGDGHSISNHLKYLDSLKILDVPKKTPKYSENEINV